MIPFLQTPTVTACTSFELQCWLYPVFFYMVVLILVLGVAALARPTGKAFMFITLFAFVEASLFSVMLGIMPITMPLLSIVIMALYAWRM